jgi:hypothetical protein
MQHLDYPVCHIKEVVDAKIPFIYVMYVHSKYIHFHLGTTWELPNFTYDWELNDN